jgi:hypothetical protein
MHQEENLQSATFDGSRWLNPVVRNENRSLRTQVYEGHYSSTSRYPAENPDHRRRTEAGLAPGPRATTIAPLPPGRAIPTRPRGRRLDGFDDAAISEIAGVNPSYTSTTSGKAPP